MPDIQQIINDIRKKYPSINNSGGGSTSFIQSPIQVNSQQPKIKFEEFSQDRPELAYKTLNSGEKVPIYENYLAGTDNQERLAQTQSTGDKWLNGAGKFFTKTGNAVLGGTIGTVYGIAEAVKEGSWNALYDNSFTRTLDDWNTKMDYQLPNYYTKQEQEEGFIGSLTNANFWANDVLGGLSFTTGAIISEGIWAAATGGASLAGSVGRNVAKLANASKWSRAALGVEKTAEGLYKMKGFFGEIPKNLVLSGFNKNSAITASKIAGGFNNARFLATSAGYEAGVEAFHYKKEATEDFYRNFKDLNGREPNSEDIAEFSAKLEDSANAVFAGNMAILAPSNAVMFGSMFNIKSPFKGVTKAVDKSLFGIGIEETVEAGGKSSFKALQATKPQKIFSAVYSTVKPIATEAIWEEGGQSVVSKTASNWIESSYNPKYNNNTIDIMDAMYKGMGETFGTKEGWKEIGIGAIIGGGMSLVQGRGIPQDLREINAERKAQEEIAQKHNKFTVAQDITARRIMMSGKVQDAVERQKVAETKGDFVSAQLAQDDTLLAEMEFRHDIGENISDLADKYELTLNNVSEQEWKDAGIVDVDAHKEATIGAYRDLLNSYKKNMEFAEAVYGSGQFSKSTVENHLAKQTLAYSLTKGESANQVMDTLLGKISETIGEENTKAIAAQGELQRLGKNVQAQVRNRNNKIKALEDKVNTLMSTLTKLQNAPKGDRDTGAEVGKVQSQIIKTNEELDLLRADREKQAENLTQERQRQRGIKENTTKNISLMQDYISGEDLAKIDDRLNNIDNIINGYKGVNPQMYAELIDLSSQYKSAQNNFLNYQSAALGLTSGKVKIKMDKVGGWLGKAFNPKQPMDEFTQQYLQHFITQRTEAELELARNIDLGQIGGAKEVVTEAEVQEAIISEERLNSIAEKVRLQQPLSNRELQLRRVHEDKVNQRVKELNEDLGTPIITTKQEETPQVQLTELESLKATLQDALNNQYSPLVKYTGDSIEELMKDKPTQSEIEEYQELIKLGENTLFDERRIELEDKLRNWKLLDSAVVGEQSLADILDLINLLETVVEQKDTKTEITEEDLPQMTEELPTTDETTVYSILQNTNANATVRKDKNGNLKFSHINIAKLFEKVGGNLTITDSKNKKIDVTPQNIEKYRQVEGTTFIITPENSVEGIKFVADNRGNFSIKEKDFTGNAQVLGLIIVNTGNASWSWKDVYEWNGAEFVEKPSDIRNDSLTGNSFELQKDDELELYIDVEDTYNKGLIEKFNKKEISKEFLESQVTIYTRKNGKNYDVFKGNRGTTTGEFYNLRKVATEALLQGQSVSIGTIKVSQVFKGSPKLNLDENGKAVSHNFNSNSLKEVATTGYFENGVLVLADKTLETKTDVSFVKGIKTSQKIPLVIIKKGKHFIAYPVSMTKTPSPQGSEVDKILENPALNEVEMVKRINQLLIENGISPSIHGLIDLSNEDKIDAIKADLDTKLSFRTASELADSQYKKEDLINDATINIDLEDLNRAISSPKVKVDFDTMELKTSYDVRNEVLTSIEDRLNTIVDKLHREINKKGAYVTNKGNDIKDTFAELFDNNPRYKDTDVHNLKISNVSIVEDIIKIASKNRNALNFIGKARMEEIKNLQSLRVKTQKNKKTEDSLKCPE